MGVFMGTGAPPKLEIPPPEVKPVIGGPAPEDV